jgi:lysyl-tRNA synthetase class 2
MDKLRRLVEMGLDPWGARFEPRQMIGDLCSRVPHEGIDESQAVRAAGRIIGIRDKGRIRFIDVKDKTGRIQVFVGRNQVADHCWSVVELLDLWDLIGVEGKLGRTRTGEITIFADSVTLLTKTLAHPPEKYHGAHDIELLLRRRYLDMIQSPEVLERFEVRSRIIGFIRRFLADGGFLEVETPTMQAIPGGAAARPFVTHHNALDIDLYMRIAPELYLKRLLVGGMDKVFEIGRVWRNEGIDAQHNPEFTLLEVYAGYADYHTMMELTESLICGLVERLGYGRALTYGAATLDLTSPWPRATYGELLQAHAGANLDDTESVRTAAYERGIATAGKHPDVIASELFKKCVEDKLTGPIFVVDYPASLCPLTKPKAGQPNLAERFELYLAGMEIANAYTELNNPVLQEELFSRQLSGLPEEESMARMDRDFITALKHGMPPAGGLGIGVDRLVMLLTNSPTIRDVILFPLLRPESGGRS